MRLIFVIILLAFIQNSFGQSKIDFKKDIYKKQSGLYLYPYYSVREIEKALNLDTIENGFDSLQIRIWYNYSKSSRCDIFIIKAHNGSWSGTIYNSENDTLIPVKPKSNWNTFINQLFAYNVLTLPNMFEVKGLDDRWKDGHSYYVEISDKSHYRLYYYHVPEEFKNKFKEPKNMVDILKLIKKEFDVDLMKKKD